jgi:hypothetical protein
LGGEKRASLLLLILVYFTGKVFYGLLNNVIALDPESFATIIA